MSAGGPGGGGSSPAPAALREAARALGVQLVYTDTTGVRRAAAPETLLAILRALGEPIERPADAGDIVQRERERRRARVLEPAAVAWDGVPEALTLRLPRARAGGPVRLEFRRDDGARTLHEAPAPLVRDDPEFEDRALVTVEGLPRLETGVWTREAAAGDEVARSTIFAAPRRLGPAERSLGLFLPLHAAHSARSRGIGNLGDLSRLMRWAGECGCDLFGVLPLLPTFLDDPVEPSPYSAITRLLPAEIFVDLPDPALGEPGPELRAELERSPPGPADGRLVDYASAWSAQMRLLRAMAADARAHEMLREELARFAERNPLAVEYAAFRARAARFGRDWSAWPASKPGGMLPMPGEQDEAAAILFGQWLAARQLARLDAEGRSHGCRLYADWPIGVHPHGFDVWRFPELFARGATVGAPPDDFSAAGQNWGFGPMLPEASRAEGHAYFRRSIALQLQAAGAIRIDHVAGLHRQLWIPAGATAAEGAYVRYPTDELYACIMIEAAQRGATVIGENLGCVPVEVTRTMRRRGFLSMRVAQFEVGADPPAPVRRGEAAMINTHDTPTFAGFAQGADIDSALDLGHIDPAEAAAAKRGRAEAIARLRAQLGVDPQRELADLLAALLRRLAASDASCVILNLEDLWLEESPQNTPGTTDERPNWRRRAARTIEQIEEDPDLSRAIGELVALRQPRRRG